MEIDKIVKDTVIVSTYNKEDENQVLIDQKNAVQVENKPQEENSTEKQNKTELSPSKYEDMFNQQIENLKHQNGTYSYLAIAKSILRSSIPATMGLLFVFLLETVNIIIIGQNNDPALIAAIGIGTLYVNATGYIPGSGLLGGIDTLCSQSFGAKNYRMVGVNASIGRVAVTMYFIIITVPMNFLASIALNAIGIDKTVAFEASHFCHAMSISVFFALQFNSSLRYLQSMNVFLPGSIVTLITAALHPMWCYFMVNILGMGVVGAGLSMGITQFLNFAIITLYIKFSNHYVESKSYYYPGETLNVSKIWDYMVKAVPAAIMFAADYIGFEILTFMASFLGPVPLAANVCLFNYITIIFMLQIGLSMAATTLVGNSIGSLNKELARLYSLISVCIGLFMMVITTALTIFFRAKIPMMYTQEEKVGKLFFDLIGIYIIFALPDSISVVLHGVIKGLGRQKWASVICLILLYPVNISLAYFLAFYNRLGVEGLWYSQMVTIMLMALSYAIYYLNIDIDQVVHEVEEHNKQKKLEENNLKVSEKDQEKTK